MPSTSQLDDRSAANLGAPFLELLPISGIAISVFNQVGQQSTIYSSDATSARLEEIQFDLGEGPLYASFRSALPVEIADIATHFKADWPMFLDAAQELGVGAVFAFPLVMGAVCIGAAMAYRDDRGGLDLEEVEAGSALGRAISGPALRKAITMAREGSQGEDGPPIEMRRDVHQATGMVLAQLDTTATEAFSRMRGYAYSSGRSLRQVAHDVISHELDFAQLPE